MEAVELGMSSVLWVLGKGNADGVATGWIGRAEEADSELDLPVADVCFSCFSIPAMLVKLREGDVI